MSDHWHPFCNLSLFRVKSWFLQRLSKDELLPIEMYINGEDSNLIEFMRSFIGLQD